MTRTAPLADYVATVDPGPADLHAATRCMVDWAGCAIGGSTHGSTSAVAATLDDTVGLSEACSLAGRAERSSPFGAALLNGVASHVLDFDDVNVTMIGHPAVVVVPAALAAAEHRHADGRRLLAAVVGGYEVAATLGAAVNPRHYELGWHATSTLGTVAAAAAAARALGLDANRTAKAMSVGATQAGGVRAMFGSHGKSLHAGRAAAAGVLAARLAERGLDVPVEVLDGATGYLTVALGGSAPASSSGTAGSPRPAVHDTAVKGHAACGATHCLIDAVAGMVRDHELVPEQIVAIEASVHRLAVQAAGDPEPTTGLQAKFSLRHAAALAVFAYPLTQEHFCEEAVADPRVRDMRHRVRIEVNDGLSYDQAMPAAVRIRLTDGRELDRLVTTPRGRPANPMTDAELGRKFLSLSSPVVGSEAAGRALGRLWRVAEEADVSAAASVWLPPPDRSAARATNAGEGAPS